MTDRILDLDPPIEMKGFIIFKAPSRVEFYRTFTDPSVDFDPSVNPLV